jgi:hypothetical protein
MKVDHAPAPTAWQAGSQPGSAVGAAFRRRAAGLKRQKVIFGE